MPLPPDYVDLPNTSFLDSMRGIVHHALNGQPEDREDRPAWYEFGYELEWRAIQLINIAVQCQLIMANRDKSAAGRKAKCLHDIFVTQDGAGGEIDLLPGDMKCQFTPYFLAGERFDRDPRRSVAFNEKDRLNYNNDYGEDFLVVFYVNHWLAHADNTECRMVGQGDDAKLRYRTVTMTPLHGAYACRLRSIHKMIDSREAVFYDYGKRKDSTRPNAKSSWLLPVDQMVTIMELDGNPLIL